MKLEYFYDKTKRDPLKALYGKRLRITSIAGDIVEAELDGYDEEDDESSEGCFVKNVKWVKNKTNIYWSCIEYDAISDITIIE